jgi:4-amino-4-deoxy-L-arabinose transferase-like glycosyltransferase
MFAKVREWLELISVGLIIPTIFSLAGLLPEWLAVGLWALETIMTIVITLLSIMDERADGRKLGIIFKGAVIWGVASIILKNFWPYPVSMSKTVSIFSALIYGSLLFIVAHDKFNKLQSARRRKLVEVKQREEEMRRRKLTDSVNRLIGNEAETKALLTALDRLTKYVPEVAERILVAVRNDVERFVMLRGLIETTQNEVLKQKCAGEADEIVTAARKLCSDSTEMALELLEEYQVVEADQTLGEVRGPQLAAAHAEFKHYLEGLKEALPKADDKLASEIDSLSPPQKTLRLTAKRSGRA